MVTVQAVKSTKQPVAAAWGGGNGLPAGPPAPTPPHRVDSEESDNEDRVPVPAFQDSFSIDISLALQASSKSKGRTALPGAGASAGGALACRLEEM